MGSGGICPGHDLGGAEESRSAAGRKRLGAGRHEIQRRLDKDRRTGSAGDFHPPARTLLDSVMMRNKTRAVFFSVLGLLCLAPALAQTKAALGAWEILSAQGEPVAREEAGFLEVGG